MLPAFATTDELADRLPGGISTSDLARAQAAIDDVSALIRSAAGENWVDENNALADVPDIVVAITLRSALRAFANPTGVTQQTVGPFSESYANASTDVYLTAAERAMVKQAAGYSGLGVVRTTRGRIETTPIACGPFEGVADEYADVDPPGEPLPFL